MLGASILLKTRMRQCWDMNMNDRTSGEFANAYVRKDPMVKNMKGSTLRDLLKMRMGNNITN